MNLKTGQTAPVQIWYPHGPCIVKLGSNSIHVTPPFDDFIPIMMDGKAVVRLKDEDGVWMLSLAVCDQFNRPVVTIEDNEIVCQLADYDIQYEAGRLTLKSGRAIIFRAAFQPPAFEISNAMFFWNGIVVAVDRGDIFSLNPGAGLTYRNSTHGYSPIGFRFGRDPHSRTSVVAVDVTRRFLWTSNESAPGEIDESELDVDSTQVD